MNVLMEFINAGRWAEAWAEFRRLLPLEPKSPRLLLAGSHAAFGMRDLENARQLAAAALEGWNESQPSRLLGQIRFHLGMVSREFGDSATAFQQFNLFLAELPAKYPELASAEGKAHFYLALTLRQREDLDQATQVYRKAIACFERDGQTSLVCIGLQNLAWVLCLMKQPDEARRCLVEAAENLDEESRIHQTMGEAFLAVTEGQYGVAAALCESIMRQGERGERLTAEERSQTAWVASLAAMVSGDIDTAFGLAGIALNHAADAQDARLINDASALRRQIQLRQATGQTGI